ncbi:hypothetical protein M9458_010588, partial [Cirrhinus mrigala]
DDEDKDGNIKEGPDSSKISTTTEDSKDHGASLSKSLLGESDSVGRRTEKMQADSRQSPITLISSTTRPGREQAKTDDCRTVSKENYMPLTVQTDGSAHLNQNHLHNFGFPPGLAGQQFFNHLGGAHPRFLKHGRRDGPHTGSSFLRRGQFNGHEQHAITLAKPDGGTTALPPTATCPGVAGKPINDD